jgi:hypothetical protein
LWKKENSVESSKCFNIERIISAEENGLVAPDSLTVDEYVAQAVAEGALVSPYGTDHGFQGFDAFGAICSLWKILTR